MDEHYCRYEYLWRNKWLTADAKTIEEMAGMLKDAGDYLLSLAADGVKLENQEPTDDYAFLVTDDPEVASKHNMMDRREFDENFDEDMDEDLDDEWEEETE